VSWPTRNSTPRRGSAASMPSAKPLTLLPFLVAGAVAAVGTGCIHHDLSGHGKRGCPSVHYLTEQKVIFCTIPKSSSSEWRRMLLRIHQLGNETLCDGKPCWCGDPGCLLNPGLGSDGPPMVQSAHQFETLRRQGYKSGFFMRDPYERVASMFTGTQHVIKHNLTSMEDFVNTIVAAQKPTALQGNEHFLQQVTVCNFGLSSVHPLAPKWDYVATSGVDQQDTFNRVSRFIKRLFGEDVYERAAAHGWCAEKCHAWRNEEAAEKSSCMDQPFFSPHISMGSANLAQMTPALRARIAQLYPDDVAYYNLQRSLRLPDGSAPDDCPVTATNGTAGV